MLVVGRAGYQQQIAAILDAARRLRDGIRLISGLFVFGEPVGSVVAFGSHELNVYAVNDQMRLSGWRLSTLQSPAAVHMACTAMTADAADQFLLDLAACVERVRGHPELGKDGTAGIYGTAASLPDKSIVAQVAQGYLDAVYAVDSTAGRW